MDEAVSKLRVVYMGTPDFAATILDRVSQWDGAEVVGVYTQPDRPCGRGQVCKPSAVKTLALEKGYDIYQPLNFKEDADVEQLQALKPDVLLVAAYGLILPQRVLDIATHGAINVHASLLPKYRGAAPIQRAIMNGDPVTGITIMQMEKGLDSGPILLQRALAIGIDDTAGTLHDELAVLGGELLVEALQKLVVGDLHPKVQDHDRSTHAAKLTKAEGLLDWSKTALELHAHLRGISPWPGGYFILERAGKKSVRVAIEPGTIGADLEEGIAPGTVLGLQDDAIAIATADRVYLVRKLRPANKKVMDAKAFACGYLAQCDDATCSGEGLC
ncbi:methionyl-tRNA formyltransferase [Halodesulfovibrio sp.]|jgi:methionyl-tRNA formyltransferase|uniref:methionyl-tRNA formyltransferase n=1 Tax=Halodesulfovibrio sp. TaxID=1912772 RepID=UPI0025F6D2C5|nr:methionyl-tRNA formyltransferase [Halodesulfovibrio sp.]MCT4535047.1 methionyl-tRNA formyltransferase [Halodesulfovibrio sp.]MCT4625866.1 methionyl-tRNA formyltransferase [Halodesulfovibrio sp.]